MLLPDIRQRNICAGHSEPVKQGKKRQIERQWEDLQPNESMAWLVSEGSQRLWEWSVTAYSDSWQEWQLHYFFLKRKHCTVNALLLTLSECCATRGDDGIQRACKPFIFQANSAPCLWLQRGAGSWASGCFSLWSSNGSTPAPPSRTWHQGPPYCCCFCSLLVLSSGSTMLIRKGGACYPAQCSSSWWAFCGFSMGNVFFWLPITAVCWCSVAGRLVLSQMQLSAVERCVRMLPREASTSLYWINKVFCMGLKALHTHRKSQRNPIRYDPSSLSALLKIQCKILNVWLHMSSEGHVSIVSWEILKIK